MDTMKSFKGYGKVDEAEEQAFRKRTRRRLLILVASAVLLLAVIAAAVVGTIVHRRNRSGSDDSSAAPPSELTPSASLKAVCSVTQYPDSCFSSISAAETANATDPEQLFKLSLAIAMRELQKLPSYAARLASKANAGDAQGKAALAVCAGVFEDAIDRLNDSISSLQVGAGTILSSSKINDMKTWLSAAITDQETCLDSLEEINSTLINDVRATMENSTEFVSNSLAIVTRIISLLADLKIPIHRKLLGSSSEFPSWLGAAERRLLQDEAAAAPAHLTVAQDGSGDYKTIQAAVDAVPQKNASRFVIYVKAGTYKENVVLDKSKWNVMMYGDGKAKTIVSGSRNFIDGTPTFNTATFAVAGKGFIARDMGFINTAGAAKHQAVAFRSGSDLSVIYRCAFDAFQDTLYAHSNRQFFRNCDVTGTIDFIFGNSAVVFQNCNIQPRQPMDSQFNTITAQGKKDPNQNTGISLQKCSITANGNVTAPTYLGRPWKDYSTTVIMQSTIDSLNPKGWTEWVTNVDPPRTIFYGEYQNSGPGSSTAQRVTWAGYKPALSAAEAGKFTVGSFIQGSDWLPQTSVTFDAAL
ncbi:pectinesterase 3 [Rhodamnia argentea]|uniref:Pectinesterase n=1 Tax=Rhodamnia argentea TaxID=178133 RepID=A0ABM3HS43_9MYRT|nr:pectinesterase 3 [Rhodamnia argentea]